MSINRNKDLNKSHNTVITGYNILSHTKNYSLFLYKRDDQYKFSCGSSEETKAAEDEERISTCTRQYELYLKNSVCVSVIKFNIPINKC